MEEDLLVSYSSEGSTSDVEEFVDGLAIHLIDAYDSQTSDEEDNWPRFGGYEYEFVDNVSDSQKCPVCLLPMRDAVQTSECGHRFCEDCLLRILRDAHPVCPNDRREIQEEGGYFYDKAWARDILCLRIKCKRNERGCDWIGQLRHVEDHKGECDYEDDECLACGIDIQRRLKETHLNEECPKRIIECVYCQDEFTFIQKQGRVVLACERRLTSGCRLSPPKNTVCELEPRQQQITLPVQMERKDKVKRLSLEHEDTYCRRFPLVCTNSCGHEEIPREEMELHLSEKCPMTEVNCPYAKAGCPFQDKRAHLNDHIEASVDDHLELTWSSLADTRQELDNMKDLQQKFYQMQDLNQKLTDSMAHCREEVRDLTLAVKSLEIQNIQQKKWMEDMTRKNAKGLLADSTVIAYSQKEVRDLKLAMKNLEMQKNLMEAKMTKELKRLELKMVEAAATRGAREQAPQRPALFLTPVPYRTQQIGISPSEECKKVQDKPTENPFL